MKELRILIISLLLLSNGAIVYGQCAGGSVSSGAIAPGLQLCIENDKYTTMTTVAQGSWGFVNKQSDGFVELQMNRDANPVWSTAFDLTVSVLIEYYNESDLIAIQAGGSPALRSLGFVDFVVNYDPASGVTEQVLDLQKIPDAYYIEAGFNGYTLTCAGGTCPGGSGYFTTISPNITLSTYIEQERAPVNPSFSYSSLAANTTAQAGYITFGWDYQEHLRAVDLEWMWIDANLASGVGSSFKHNASRVRLDASAVLYQIPDIYEAGHVIFRVRPVYYCGSTYDKECQGAWTIADGTDILASSIPGTYPEGVQVSGHEEDLNWTYNLTLAEEGKHKAVVGYADGTLRNRQMVSKINSLDKIVVAESIYDHLGRNAISVLPVPVENSVIGYTADFNMNQSNVPYSYRDFELSQNCAAPAVAPMDKGSGASQYYSDQTNSTQEYRDYIPDAHEYPFAVTRFENNPLGLVKEQGGLGPVHQAGGDHSTKYYYGQPNQEELDRLFGTDAGYAQNYSKVITVDANGQRSISIRDMAGNVVATALEGDSPSNLESIGTPDQLGGLDMMGSNVREVNGKVASSSLEYYVFVEEASAGSPYELSYSFRPEKYKGDCELISGLCYDCIYDLNIKVYETECNTGSPIKEYTIGYDPSDYLDENYSPNCDATSLYTAFLDPAPDPTALELEEGYYKITKTLTLREEAIDFFTERYVSDLLADRDAKLALDPNAETCVKTLNDFVEEEFEKVDWTDCFYTCETCEEALAEIAANQGSGSPEYAEQSELCEAICGGSPCEAAYQSMLADVSPNGQYGLYKTMTYVDDIYGETPYDFVNGSSYNEGLYSLMNEKNKLPAAYFTDNGGSTPTVHNNYSWRTPIDVEPGIDGYVDAQGNASLFMINGIPQGPENFATVEEFIDHWEPSWARSLVFYHPEYLYYEFCKSMDAAGSNDFDEYQLQTATYEEAYDLQLFDPLNENLTELPANYRADINDLGSYTQDFANGDPFFASGGPGNAYRQDMIDAMNAFYDRPDVDGTFSIWEYASYLAFCVDLSDPGDRAQCIKDFTYTMASTGNACITGDEADMWRYFKALYWQKKQEFVNKAQTAHAFNYAGYNGCIGMDPNDYLGSKLIHPSLEALAFNMGGTHTPTKKKWDLSLSRPYLYTTVYNYRNDPEQTCFEESSDYERLQGFADKDKRFAHNIFAYLELSAQASTDMDRLITDLQGKISESNDQSCEQECEANARQWTEELRDLAESQNPSLVWEPGATKYEAVYTSLQSFCELHCGQGDHFGSYGDASNSDAFSNKMEELIEQHIEDPISVAGHAAIVRAESNRLFADQFTSYLDDCGCDLLTTAQEAYENLVACNDHEGQSIESYLYDNYGIQVGNVYDLLCKCESLNSSDLLVEKIQVPSGLTCTSCPSCYQLDKVIFDFDCKYGALLPTATVFEFLDLSNEMKETFADYANLRLNLSLSAAQYEQALECCDIAGCDIDNTSHKAHYWKNFLEALRDKSKIELPVDHDLQWNTIDKADADFADFFEHIMCEGTTNPTGLSDDYYVTFMGGRSSTYGLIVPSSSISGSTWVPLGYTAMFSLKFLDIQKSLSSPTRNGYDIEDITSFNRVFVYKGMSSTRAIMEVSLADGACARVMFEMHYVLATTPGAPCENLDIHGCNETAICSGMSGNPNVGPNVEEDQEFVVAANEFTPSTESFNITIAVSGERTATDYLVDYSMVENANPGSKGFRDGIGQLLADNGINASVSYSECTVNCDDCGASQLSLCCGNAIYTDQVEDLFASFTAGTVATNLLTNSQAGSALTVDGQVSSGTHINSWLRPAACSTSTTATYTTGYYEAGEQVLNGSIAFDDCSSCEFYLYTDAANFDYADITAIQSLEYDEDGQSSYHSNNFKMVVTTGSNYCLDGVNGTAHTIYGYSTCWELTECAGVALVCDRGVSLPVEDPCVTRKLNVVRANAQRKYNQYIAQLKADFQASYTSQCILDIAEENFSSNMASTQQHYTLYYYDQARNLVQTVPPAGVSPLSITSTVTDNIASHRADPSSITATEPTHSLETTYQFNSLGGTREQETPDGGITTFLYDDLGRLVFSQDAKQKEAFSGTSDEHFSYSSYDNLGRIEEVGQIKINVVSHDMTRANIKIAGEATSIIASNAANKTKVTKTFYDSQTSNGDALTKLVSQDNMVLRVSSVAIKEDGVPTATDYDHASYYSYDIMGNVKTLVQDIKALADVGQQSGLQLGHNLKRVDYDYDLISGNVNQVSYQKNEADQYYHRYDYDADNRINSVELSYDGHSWSQDARYKYYDHGPLARTELGAEHVQGMDYAYTLQGWIKAVNGNFLDKQHDMGQDGYTTSSFTGHSSTAHDAFGYVLGYYQGANPSENDYSPVDKNGTATQFIADPGTFTSLYNGNIGYFSVNHSVTMGNYSAMNQTYTYDQLNRIKVMTVDNGIDMTAMAWNNNPGNDYKTQLSYDANGNIQFLRRFGDASQALNMDLLKYTYYAGTNQLQHVQEMFAPTTVYADDFEDMGTNDYKYDEIGNLIEDKSEKIDAIEWTVYGKVKSVTRTALSGLADLDFTYDASGNRSTKTVKNGPQADDWERTYYVRDASGNLLATYKSTVDNNVSNGGNYVARFSLEEQQLYGSARLGIKKINEELFSEEFSGTLGADIWDYAGAVVGQNNVPTPGDRGEQIRGDVRYELADHLGNVRSVITDRKLPTQNGGGVDYAPDVVSAQDYYPFGMLMPGRQYANVSFTNSDYRFGFNGMERDDEVKGSGNSYDFGARIYDARLGRWLARDPMEASYMSFSPYNFVLNSPIGAKDPDGEDVIVERKPGEGTDGKDLIIITVNAKWTDQTIYGQTMQKRVVKHGGRLDGLDKNSNKYQRRLSKYNKVKDAYDTYAAEQMDQIKESVNSTFGEGIGDEVDWDISFNLSDAFYDGIEKTDHVFHSLSLLGRAAGMGYLGGLDIYIDPNEMDDETPAHELGHSIGLLHPWDNLYNGHIADYLILAGEFANKPELYIHFGVSPNNIMSYEEPPLVIDEVQILKVESLYYSGALNGKSSRFGPNYDKVPDEKKSEHQIQYTDDDTE